MDKKYVSYYLKGYLNEYINNIELLKYQKFNGSFRSYKLMLAFRYLGLKQVYIESRSIFVSLGICDVIFTYLMLFIRLISSFVLKLSIPTNNLPKGELLMLGIAPFTTYTKGVLKNEFKSKHVLCHIPFTPKEISEKSLNILSCLSYVDLLSAFWASCKLSSFMALKYFKRDFLFRSHSSYEFFLTCLFVKKVEFNNTFISCEIINRWAFLMLNLNTHKIFIQHGKTQCTHYIKVGTPDVAYFMNNEQMVVHDEFIFKQKPKVAKVVKVFEYSGCECLLNNGKKDVMIVCNTLFIDDERTILELLSDLDINLYLKTHPLTKTIAGYENMRNIRPFSYVPKESFPKVDCVISYESTLADEYKSVGAFVVLYDKLEKLDQLREIIINIIKGISYGNI